MGKEDGWVTIKLDMDSKNFDAEIKRTTKELTKLQQKEKELIYLNTKLKEAQSQGKALTVTSKELNLMDKLGISMDDIGNKNTFLKVQEQIQKANNKLIDLRKKQDELNDTHVYENIGKGISKVIKKVAKWSLAVIGIRSIYLGIRSAMSTLSEYDDTIGARVDYLKWVLANAIKPVIEWIIQALYKIIGLFGRIIYNIIGKNIFEDSGIGDYEKALKNSSKNAKELKKTIAGFDEMNVVSDNSTKTATLPGSEYDINNIINQKTKIEKVVDDLIKKWFNLKQEMDNALSNPEAFDKAYGEWGTFMYGITQFFVGLWDTITGINEFLGGIIDIIVGLFTLNGKKIVEGVKWVGKGTWDIIKGLLEMILGLLEMIIGLIKGIVVEFIKGVWGLIKFLFEFIVTIVKATWNFVSGIISGIARWIYNVVIKPVGDFFAGMWNGFKEGAKSAWEGVKSVFSNVANFFGDIFGKAWQKVKDIFSTGGQIFSGIKDGILEAFKRIVNAIIDGINTVVRIPFNGINSALGKLRDVDLWGWKPFEWIPKINVPQIPRLAKGGIINQPGRGVAIGGEQGQEGVLPLTDAQQMSLLGEAIGKYITVNLTNITNLDGRLLARKVEQINNNNRFVLNK